MLKSVTAIALSAVLLGGCATINQDTVATVQKALNYAKGIHSFANAALAKYDARKPCGEPQAPKLCRDLNVSQTAGKVLVAGNIVINDVQAQINLAVTTGKIDEAVLTSALLTVVTDTLAIVDLFDAQ